MKIVFLDFDGVLNSLTNIVFGISGFKSEAIDRLNQIVHRSQAKVVVSSSWRVTHSLEELRTLLAEAGFRGEVIDCTPQHVTMVPTQFMRAGTIRCHEIQTWLDAQSFEVESFVILDDIELEELAAFHVHTDLDEGLCDHHVDQALGILG